MIRTPDSFAAIPKPSGDFDVLADALRALRLNGAVFLDACFTEPFGVLSPKRFDKHAPLAHLRHISIFHLIAEGNCVLEIATGEQRRLVAGDVVLLPFADAHRFWNGPFSTLAFAPDIMRPAATAGMWRVSHGGGGAQTRMVCGFIESAEFLFAPVFRSLPVFLVERAEEGSVGALIVKTVHDILALASAAAPGADLVLGRLMETLFCEMLRQHAAKLPPQAKGWFAGLNEPIVAKALEILHKNPAAPWTVEDIAVQAGTSRTVLAGRFTSIIGQTPIEYLTSWRMQIAAARLQERRASIAEIAAEVGYDSEAAFNRAFKRVTGLPPGRWRDQSGSSAA